MEQQQQQQSPPEVHRHADSCFKRDWTFHGHASVVLLLPLLMQAQPTSHQPSSAAVQKVVQQLAPPSDVALPVINNQILDEGLSIIRAFRDKVRRDGVRFCMYTIQVIVSACTAWANTHPHDKIIHIMSTLSGVPSG